MKICRSNEKKQTIRFDTDPDRTARVKKTKKKAAFLSVALSGAMIVSLFSAVFVAEPEKASAAESLPGIESIKADLNKGVTGLKILEITDGERDSAVFGYSIEGQEPVDLVEDILKKTYPSDSETGRLARKKAGDAYYWNLVGKELIFKNSTKHELTFTNEFNEYYPWDYSNNSDLKELSLDSPETVSVTAGSYRLVGDQKGGFIPSGNSYGIDANSGTYAQDLAAYTGTFVSSKYVDNSEKDDYIFYTPVLKEFYVDSDSDGKAHFYEKLNEETGEPEVEISLNNINGKYVFTSTKDKDDEIAAYNYYGTFGKVNRWERRTERDEDGKRVLKPYYYLDSLMMDGDALPLLGFDLNDESFNEIAENDEYFALSISRVKLSSNIQDFPYKKYFTFDPKGFEYVGENLGNYEIYVKSVDKDSAYTGEGGGDSKFDVTYDKEYYYCDVKNNNLFLKFVLDYDEDTSEEELSKAAEGIEVDVVKYSDLSESANSEKGQNYALKDYGLIVVQPGSGKFEFAYTIDENGNRLSSDLNAFVDKLKKPALQNIPIIFSACRDDYGYYDIENSAPHWLLVAKIIAEFSKQKYSVEDHVDGSENISKKGKAAFGDAGRWKVTNDGYDKGYVDGNLLFYVKNVNKTKNEVFLDKDLSTPIEKLYYENDNSGFNSAYDEIQYENFLRQREGKTGDDLLKEDELHLGNLIRYILNSKSRRKVSDKDNIRILEIQPDNHSQLNTDNKAYPNGANGLANDTVLSWFNKNKSAQNITITTMSTYEFVGKIDDITEDFDIVYVGSDITDFHKKSDGTTNFNDNNMDGLIYYNIGDYNYSTEGWRAKELVSGDQDTIKLRYSGNDLTEKKLTELEAFSDAGYPVVFSDELLRDKSTVEKTVNFDKVDVNSRMYKFIEYVAGKGNAYPSTQVGDSYYNSKFMLQLSLSKPRIHFADGGKPLDYAEDPGNTNSTHNAISDRTLRFEFEILNESDATPLTTTYSLHLYIDRGADGIFSEDDEVGISPSDITGGSTTSLKASPSADNHIFYTLTRRLPDEVKGMVSWKLLVKKNGEKIHTSEKGYAYTPIRAGSASEPITINILQINMEKTRPAQNNEYDVYGKDTYDLEWQDEQGAGPFGKLFSQLENKGDYDLKIKTVSTTEVNKYYNENGLVKNPNDDRNINKTNDPYNMLIIGFGDAYGELEEKTAEAVTEFIDTGKAVLFSHDNTAPCNNKEVFERIYSPDPNVNKDTSGHGYYFNTIVRDRVGLDRYGVSNDDTLFTDATNPYDIKYYRLGGSKGVLYNKTQLSSDQIKAIQEEGYDIAFKPSKNPDHIGKYTDPFVHGFTDLFSEGLKPVSVEGSYLAKYEGVTYKKSDYSTDTITMENEGQITKYPFDLGGAGAVIDGRNSMTVSQTHLQYYQMNMSADDLIVWYCLGQDSTKRTKGDSDLYSVVPNDIANQYYIFTRGNITYSGCGHGGAPSHWSDPTNSEAKLFINTMIAAYRAGYQPPEFDFVSGEGANAVPVPTIYLPSESIAAETTVGQDVDYSAGESGGSAGGKISFRFNDKNMSASKKLTLENIKIVFDTKFEDSYKFQTKNVNATFNNYWITIDKDGYVVVPHLQNKNDNCYRQTEGRIDNKDIVNAVVTYYPEKPNENMVYSDKSKETVTFLDEDGNPVENGDFVSGKTYSIDIEELSRIFFDTASLLLQDGSYFTPVHISPNFTFSVTPVTTAGGVSVSGNVATLQVKTLEMFGIG